MSKPIEPINDHNQEEEQEQELGVNVIVACCSNCIRVDLQNGCSVAEGNNAMAIGRGSHAEGGGTMANGQFSHAEGAITRTLQDVAHAEGQQTTAGGFASHAEGDFTRSMGLASHSEGGSTFASGDYSHAEGDTTTSSGWASHAEGRNTVAKESAAHAEGRNTTAIGEASHAEGSSTMAMGAFSHAEGDNTSASVTASHAEGQRTLANSTAAHAEGIMTVASGEASHAEGFRTMAAGNDAHAEGSITIASGFASHAEGDNTLANGFVSHAEGTFTSANLFPGAHIMGRFGDANEPYSWFLANGTSSTDRGLAAKISTTGVGISDRGWRGGGADYAEMFETFDGQSIDVGYFVTLTGEKVRKANDTEDYILGVVSANPAVLADSGELRWKNKYVTDEWGRVEYQDVVIPAKEGKEGKVIVPERIEKQPILNPDWNPELEYIPRTERHDWAAVGLLGKLLVRDDGTCQVNGYCKPNKEGIATSSRKGYRVMKRTGPNQIFILFK
ncbi:peptidase G2 autoproteolytic cleavage domain-containing protein [Cytobacillus oceanisediminis]|uniref:peptidase G2 autoproteolytic cleavage domain-containing protein n=1 Tax=Cytobacillus oceanisediminis TaxID=665099 RepID=UPI003736932D